MNNIPIDMASITDLIKTMYVFIRERVRLDKEGFYPSKIQLVDATIKALKSMAIYAEKYGINSSNRDSVKIFVFVAVHFNKTLNVSLRPRGFQMKDETIYLACLDFIATTYPNVNFSKHSGARNTARILANIASNGDELAPYIYRGLQEAYICQK